MGHGKMPCTRGIWVATICIMMCSMVMTSELRKKETKPDETNQKEVNKRTLKVNQKDEEAQKADRRTLQLDQIAMESGGGGGYQSVVAPPPMPQLLPVPLPLPVHPGAIVIPTMGKHDTGYGTKRDAPPPPVYKQPHGPRTNNPPPVSHFPPGALSKQMHAPPPPPPQPSYPAPSSLEQIFLAPPQEAYNAPPPQPAAQSYNPPPLPPPPGNNYNIPAPQQAPPPHGGDYGAPKSADLHSQVAQPQGTYEPLPSNHVVPQAAALQGSHSAPASTAYVPPVSPADDPWQAGNPDMPQISNINVKCEKNLMKVTIDFDRPFYGIIFSKGHYSNVNCVHLPAGLGRSQATFDISINACGTVGNTENGLYGFGSDSGSGTFFENTLVIQYDPQVQEIWDQARKLRCTWHDQYEKSVTFRPFPVDMLNVVRADFAGDNVGCWMQIQVGKGPWASEVSGLVKIGDTMTMVLAIKDDDNKFDMLVRNCMAHDGQKAPIQLVDQQGCVTRPKLMSKFTKIKNFGASASVLSYAYFNAFKFPDSMEVHFQCTIQICRHNCPDQCASGGGGIAAGPNYETSAAVGEPRDSGYGRKKRETKEYEEEEQDDEAEKDIGVNRVIQVVSTRDLGFLLDKDKILKELKEEETLVAPMEEDQSGFICMSTPGFAASLVVLLSILIISCLLSAFLCLRFRGQADTQSIISSYDNPAFLHKKGFF